MGSSGVLWSPIESYRVLWGPLGPCGVLWSPKESYGVLWKETLTTPIPCLHFTKVGKVWQAVCHRVLFVTVIEGKSQKQKLLTPHSKCPLSRPKWGEWFMKLCRPLKSFHLYFGPRQPHNKYFPTLTSPPPPPPHQPHIMWSKSSSFNICSPSSFISSFCSYNSFSSQSAF